MPIRFMGTPSFMEQITIQDTPDKTNTFILSDSIANSKIEFLDGKAFTDNFPAASSWYPDKSSLDISGITGTYTITTYPMTALPAAGIASIAVNKFDTSLPQGNTLVDFDADSTNGTNVSFSVSTLKPNTSYIVKKDGVTLSSPQSDANGKITFSNSSWTSHNFTVTELGGGSPTPTPLPKTATISTSSTGSNFTVGTPFNVDVVVDGGGTAFNAAEAGVTVSPNLTISGLSTGNCNFTYTETPTLSNPSFAGAILSSSSTNCRVYTLTLTPLSGGTGTITFTNGSVKAYSNNGEILSSVQNGSYTISSPTPTPTSTPIPTPTPTNTPVPTPTNTPIPTPTSTPIPTSLPTSTPTPTPTPIHKLGDINGDGIIDLTDVSLFATDWKKTTALNYSYSDINSDGIVDLTDFSILAKNYGI